MRSFFLFISANNFALGYTGGFRLACDDDVRLVLFVIHLCVMRVNWLLGQSSAYLLRSLVHCLTFHANCCQVRWSSGNLCVIQTSMSCSELCLHSTLAERWTIYHPFCESRGPPCRIAYFVARLPNLSLCTSGVPSCILWMFPVSNLHIWCRCLLLVCSGLFIAPFCLSIYTFARIITTCCALGAG